MLRVCGPTFVPYGKETMKLVIFGLTLTSSWGNGHAVGNSVLQAVHGKMVPKSRQ